MAGLWGNKVWLQKDAVVSFHESSDSAEKFKLSGDCVGNDSSSVFGAVCQRYYRFGRHV
jgi:hypothetical protein